MNYKVAPSKFPWKKSIYNHINRFHLGKYISSHDEKFGEHKSFLSRSIRDNMRDRDLSFYRKSINRHHQYQNYEGVRFRRSVSCSEYHTYPPPSSRRSYPLEGQDHTDFFERKQAILNSSLSPPLFVSRREEHPVLTTSAIMKGFDQHFKQQKMDFKLPSSFLSCDSKKCVVKKESSIADEGELSDQSMAKPSRKNNITIHHHNQKRRFQCMYCEKSFGKSSHLRDHHRTHSGERPFGCQYCGKAFSQFSNLRTHLRIHTGEKPFKCHVCEKSFTQRVTLRSHMRTHAHASSKTFLETISLK